jgi:hypothetical protein
LALSANADVFYGGDTKGLPGDPVHLTVNARAGTVLEGIDIVPNITAVSGILDFGSFTQTTGLTDGGSAVCFNNACSVFYLPEKTFAQDTLLATVSFTIDSAAPVGLVNFDPGVVVGINPLPIGAAQQFEVLAIPEPSNWALLLAGLAVLILAVPRCRRAQARFGARRAAVLRASRRWAGLPRRELSR